ncbi:tubulin epsilon and delta complex protein 2 isoform X1 [Callorhinchus milii]|uniref:tubulin epsilon and delta complex protein 2 isoform X1 n=1 Tax=Callorhinchus milii TaxID=7868 RepID=UPI001C3FC0C1|nr:tubulin epsilon and delta complex protein 2 isoform X1 [Callorhinchus milii]
MLPAAQALRLISLLQEAIEECTKEEQKVEEKLKCYRQLLNPWKLSALERPAEDKTTTDHTGSDIAEPGPTAGELQELELLNKALTKALRIRKAHCTAAEEQPLRTLATQDSPALTKDPSASVKQETSPPSNSKTKALSCDARVGAGSAATGSATGELPALGSRENHPASGRPPLKAGQMASRKTMPATVRAPYKTQPDIKKSWATGASGRSVKASCRSTAPSRSTEFKEDSVCVGKSGGQHRPSSGKRAPGRSVPLGWSGIRAPAEDKMLHSSASAAVDQPRIGREVTAHGGTSLGTGRAKKQPEVFSLQGAGSKLKLPMEWRKQRVRNTRLWKKVSAIQTGDSSETTCFIQRLQSTFQSELPTVSRAEIKDRLEDICDVGVRVDECVRADLLLLTSGLTTWQQEYKHLQTLTSCQETVSSLLHQIQQLRDAEAKWRMMWSHSGPRLRRCPRSRTSETPLLIYSSLQELKEMETLKHQVKTLQRQIQIQRVMAEELLPILFSLELQEDTSSLYLLYRAMYCQLCEGGQQFPTLVVDNIPD